MLLAGQNQQMGALKRKMGAALKKAGFKPSQKLGVVGRLHGNFPTYNFGYNIAKDEANGDYIFISGTDYQVVEVIERTNMSVNPFDWALKNRKEYELKGMNCDVIHNYLGEDKLAMVNYKESKDFNKDAKNALIQQLYNCLVDNGFGNHIQIIPGYFGDHIKITL